MDVNVKKWEEVYDWNKTKKNYLEIPDEELVRIVNKFFIPENVYRVLDIGCGSGRHTVYMLSKGMEVHGLDSSETALHITGEVVKGRGYSLNTKLSECTSLPYSDSYFDSVVCWGVIHYLTKTERRKCFNEILRILKSGGLFALTLRSNEDSESEGITNDDEISKSTAEENSGMYLKYYSQQEVLEELKQFSDIKYGHRVFSEVEKMNRRIAHWLILCRKGR